MRTLDLDADSRAALELDELLGWIASRARTAAGGEAVRGLVPGLDVAALRREHATVAEARAQLRRDGRLLPARLPDHREASGALAVDGLALSALALRSLAVVAGAGAAVRGRLLRVGQVEAPHLVEIVRTLADFTREAQSVLRGSDPEGHLLDEASPALREIRAAKRRLEERLRGQLLRLVRDPSAESVIRDDFVTQRNGRFVVPVRADAPRPVQGIVHASSSSGATRFVEPLAAVELNNELVRAAEREQEEEERVLAGWSESFRARRDDLALLLEAVVALDGIEARAVFGEEIRGTAPDLEPDGPLVLGAIRHPLLDRRLAERGGGAVPLTVALDPAAQVLVLSGPNTGGKTVALKTLGLAVLMAQSGIPLPAASARLPVYRQLRADIGDHQSIEADLSTFSAHVRAVARCVEGAKPPALLLFDEIGTGTEPTEGAALAQAILESLVGRGLTVVATTHLSSLKAWAFMREGAASAAMELDPDTLRPTFAVVMGAAGSSAGIAIAERLGLPAAIIARARGQLGREALVVEDYLERLRTGIAAVDEERAALARRLAEVERERGAERERLREADGRRAREAGESLARALEDWKREARAELAGVTDERERARMERRLGRAERRLAGEAAAAVRTLAPSDARSFVPPGTLRPNMVVHVRSLGRDGELVRERGEQVDVRLGQMTFTVARSDLLVPEDGAPAPPTPVKAGGRGPNVIAELAAARGAAARGAFGSTSTGSPGAACARELVLIGERVEEALARIDRYLDAAVLAGHEEVRIVHGHGTGRLRTAVRRHLATHPQVREHRAGRDEEGGDAATFATLL